MKNLEETIKPMMSDNYKERFRAEYWQTKIRYEKLHKTIIKLEAGTLNYKPTCSIELLKEQARTMGEYLHILEIRAAKEYIMLEQPFYVGWD